MRQADFARCEPLDEVALVVHAHLVRRVLDVDRTVWENVYGVNREQGAEEVETIAFIYLPCSLEREG